MPESGSTDRSEPGKIQKRRRLVGVLDEGSEATGARRVRSRAAASNQIDTLNRLVVIFLETAELRAKNRQETRMSFWKENVDQIIVSNDFPLLDHAGSITHQQMEEQTSERYLEYDERRKQEEARQADREESLVHLLRVNVLKRMESSVSSFVLTVQRQLEDVDATLARIENQEQDLEEIELELIDHGLEELEEANFHQEIQVEINKRKLGEDNPDIAPSMYKLGRWYERSGQIEMARLIYQDARRLL